MPSDDNNANETELIAESRSGWSGVCFNLADRRVVIAASDLIEVHVCRSLARVPGTQPWVTGLTGLRGQVLAVLDLHAYMSDGEPMLKPSPAQVMVFSRSDTLYYGLVCSEFQGIQKFPSPPDTGATCSDQKLAPFVAGVVRGDDGDRWVINPARLLDDSRFLEFSAAPAAG